MTIGRIFALFRGINVHPAYLLIPIALSIVAAAFEGASVGLLIPLLNGFLSKDFSFVTDAPILSELISELPVDLTRTDRALFGVLLVIFVVATLLKNIFRYCSVASMCYFADRSFHHLRKVLFGRYLTFGKLYFDQTSVGHHATVLQDFTYGALRPVLMVSKYINALFSIVVYLVVMSMISWRLTVFALPLFGVLHLCVRRLISRLQWLSRSIAERSSALGKKTVEILSLIPLVKAYGTENLERRRYTELSDEKARLDFKVNALHEFLLPFQEVITLLSATILFSGMLYLMVRQNVATAPSFIVYFYLVLHAASKFGTLTGFRATLAKAQGPIEAVCDIISDEGKAFVRGGSRTFEGLRDSIAFQNLSFAYPGGRHVLTDITFRIPKGRMTAIVGSTGGGKTTIINLIMRYYDCNAGELFIDDTDIRGFSIGTLMRHMALVSQETMLLSETLRHNITYGIPYVFEDALQSAIERARLKDFIAELPAGLETIIGDRGVKLSGGEKQRVSIARALLKGSEILILDEATSSLDSRTERLIQEAIEDVIQKKTAIVVAHRLSTIRNADNIIVIDKGRKVEEGSLEELLEKRGIFRGLWDEQKFS